MNIFQKDSFEPQIVSIPNGEVVLVSSSKKETHQTELLNWFFTLLIAVFASLTIWQVKLAAASCDTPISTPISSATNCIPVTAATPISAPANTPAPTNTPAPVSGEGSILTASRAAFYFGQWQSNKNYRIDLATTSDMSSDVYLDFVQGQPNSQGQIWTDNPQRWDKYSCGKTLYWRVLSDDRQYSGSIHTATVSCNAPIILTPGSSSPTPLAFGYLTVSLLSYNNDTNQAQFKVSGPVGGLAANKGYNLQICRKDGSTCNFVPSQAINTNIFGYAYIDQNIVDFNDLENPIASLKLTEPTSCSGAANACLTGSYSSPVGPYGAFSGLSGELYSDTAIFKFNYSGDSNQYAVDVSDRSDMSSNVYLDFVKGNNKNLATSDLGRFGGYSCNKILYWRVWNYNRTIKSPIQSTQVGCLPKSPATNLQVSQLKIYAISPLASSSAILDRSIENSSDSAKPAETPVQAQNSTIVETILRPLANNPVVQIASHMVQAGFIAFNNLLQVILNPFKLFLGR